jgi:preprotein translocase subunit SecE
MLDLYVEILKLTNDRNVEMLDRGKEFMDEPPEVVSKFFKSIVKDVRKVVVPEWPLKMSLKSRLGIVLSK